MEGYRKQATKLLNDQIERMEVEDEVVVDEHSFSCYVMDDWDWKHQFLLSNSTYSGTARAQTAST